MKKIYLVTMLTEIDYCVSMNDGGCGYDHRVVGWFPTLKEAEDCLKTNCGDVHETNFDYSVIEEIEPGFYSAAHAKKHWYEWIKELEGYQSINEPPQWHNVFAIGMG